jgi:hypothetical protein
VTRLDCDPAEAVRIGLAAAGGKNLEVFSPTIGRQLLELGLIDEIDLHIAPILLGGGKRLYDNPGGGPARLELSLVRASGPSDRWSHGCIPSAHPEVPVEPRIGRRQYAQTAAQGRAAPSTSAGTPLDGRPAGARG